MWRSAVAVISVGIASSSVSHGQLPPPARSAFPQWATDTSRNRDLQLPAVAGVQLGMSEARVRALLGGPDTAYSFDSPVLDSARVLRYPGAEAVLNSYGVQTFTCWGRGCRLPGSVRIGSSLRSVVTALGRGHPGYGRGVSHSLFYYPRRCDCWLEIQFDHAARVRRLIIEADNS